MSDFTGRGLNLPGDDVNLAQDVVGANLAIHLSQQADSNEQWKIIIRARTEQGDFEIGTILTRPPSRGDPPNRCVAQAFCPGADNWTVELRGPDKAKASLTLTSDKKATIGNGVASGVVALHGTEIVTTDFETVVAAGQGVLMPGPGQLFSFYGFTDPAQGLSYIGLVDKDPAALVVVGDPWVKGSLVQLPAGGASFALAFPRGLRFAAAAHFAVSAAPGVVVGALVGAATVHAERA